MESLKRWLLAVLVLAALNGTVMVINLSSSSAVAEEKGPGDHWRNYDGHWSYWHEGDRRWYYTDGTHWYYHNGTGWVLYEFDKLFGRIGFHHGTYKVPVDHAKIVLPRHDIYRH
jgi:hypothetical protein